MKMKLKNLLLIIVITTFAGCKSEKKEIELPIEIKEFIYKLPDSDYVYLINISEISIQIVKEAFTVQEDKYSVSTTEDGHEVSMELSITNPYDKAMNNVPLPNRIFISSKNEETITNRRKNSHKKADREIYAKITNANNKEIEANRDCEVSRYCVNFKTKETKKFKVTFESPIYKNIKSIILQGLESKNVNAKAEETSTETRFLIDLEKKKITNIISL